MKIEKKKKMKVKLVAKMDTMIQRESEGAVLVSKNTDKLSTEASPNKNSLDFFEKKKK